jgi:hypothetical protein
MPLHESTLFEVAGARFLASSFVLALGFALTLGPPPAARASELDQSRAEQKLGAGGLVGIWSCAGSYAGKPVTATMRWYHLEDGSFWNTLHPAHPNLAGKARATIVEAWQWDAEPDGSRWLTAPDPSSSDQATFSSPGLVGHAMTWTRRAAQSTMSRTFTFSAQDRLSFVERYGGDGGTPAHVVYSLSCKRTMRHEPPPA